MLIGDSKFYAEIAAGMVEEFALSSGKLDNVRVWFNNKVRASVNQFYHHVFPRPASQTVLVLFSMDLYHKTYYGNNLRFP